MIGRPIKSIAKNWLYLLLVIIALSQYFCQSKTDQQVVDGEKLFNTYCKNCHSEVSPEHLPKSIWKSTVLDRMGTRLGIYTYSLPIHSLLEENYGGQLVENAKLFPSDPLISSKDWETLSQYIIDHAPKTLSAQKLNYTISPNSMPFNIIEPAYRFSPPSTTFIKIEGDQNLYIGDANTQSLSIIRDRNLIGQAKLEESPVDIVQTPSSTLVLTMGSFSPTDIPNGKIISLPKSGKGKTQILVDSLNRPVDMDLGDIDNDGDIDIVVAEFGKWLGKLTLLVNEKSMLQKRVIDETTGCTKSILNDINGDGKLDIIALFGQGDERISAYINTGNMNFERKDLVVFHPSMGSSYMELCDWNQDGRMDIIFTSGDNADYAPTLKPYHGIYIYENIGETNFKQLLFLPLHGAYKAIPFDFDKDGDLDIAAISFFPDFDIKKSGFALFKNDGSSHFSMYSKLDHSYGRWITMDVGDIDLDGDDDIALGSLCMEVPNDSNQLMNGWIANGFGHVILENRLVSK